MRRGFSMAELMVTVSIIGVLSAIAIPAWREAQFQTKRAEIPGNVAGIRTAELGYYAAWSRFVEQTDYLPRTLGNGADDRSPVAWPDQGEGGGFDTLGWRPDGQVRGVYSVPVAEAEDLQIDAACNVDGNDDIASFFATESLAGSWDSEVVY